MPMLPALFTISPARCGSELGCGAAKLALPGLVRAKRAKSCKLLMPEVALATNTSGLVPMVATELRSVSGLNCGFL